jgi:hypothetical protein
LGRGGGLYVKNYRYCILKKKCHISKPEVTKYCSCWEEKGAPMCLFLIYNFFTI